MSALEALLTQGTAEPTAPKVSALESLLVRQEDAAPSPPLRKRAAEPSLAGRIVKPIVAGAADLTDLGLVGLPAMAVGVAGDMANRVIGLFDSRTRAGVFADSELITKTIQEAAGTPIRTLLTNMGAIDKTDETAVSKVMDAFGEALDKAGASVEEGTGGKIAKQDFLSVANATMASLGGLGFGKGVTAYGKRAEAKAAAKMQSKFGAKAAEEAALREEAGAPARAAAESAARAETELAALRGQAQARSMIKTPERPPAAPTQLDALRAEAERQQATRGAGATGVVDPALSAQIADLELRTLAAQRKAQADLAAGRPSPKTPDPVPPPSVYETARNKVREGKSFDLTALEKIAIRTRAQGMDPKVLTAAVVGATGLGLAMAYEPDASEAALAIGAGALVMGKGHGLTLEALKAVPDATPLGRIREQMATSLSTLEMLPGNRFEFTKDAVSQLLRRQEVTKAERDVLQGVLDATPGETITAKQLVAGFRERTGDFELKAKQTDQFADYGLANLDRVERSTGNWQDWIPEDAAPDEVARIEAEGRAAEAAAPVPTTTIWQSPLELGTSNHFNDPNYFAHTRSFVEGGVKHVVEIQSDLVQKAGKELTPEEVAALVARQQDLAGKIAPLHLELGGRPLNGMPAEFRRRMQALSVEAAEVGAKLNAHDSATAVGPVRPMLKSWHKRLIREELAVSARAGEPGVRFATADTVAKVEGWPESQTRAVDPDNIDYGIPETQRFRPEHQGIYDRYAGDITKFLKQLGGKEVTDSAGHTWIEVPTAGTTKSPAGGRVLQFGKSDPAVLAAITAMGGSALLASWLTDPATDREGNTSSTPKIRNGFLAAAGTAALSLLALKRSSSPGVAQKASSILRDIEDFAGNTSYQIEKLSPPVLRAVDNYKMGQLVRTQNYLHAATPFAEVLRRASPEAGKALDAALLTGDWPTALKALGDLGVAGAFSELTKVRALLGEVGKDLLASGAVRGLVDNYYPRVVADLDGLLGALGKPAREFLDRAVTEAQRKAGRPLDDIELSQVVNRTLENSLYKRGGDNSGFRAGRSISEVTTDLAKFYAPASESLVMYLDWAANAIERAKFFGKHAERDAATGKLDLDVSIGNVMYALDRKQALSRADSVELRRLLGIEFTYANQFGSGLLQSWNRLTTASLIANAGSALMNLGDTGQAINMYGLAATAKAIQQTFGRSDGRVTRQMLGLADTIANEFTGADKVPIIVNVPGYGGVRLSTAKFLDASLKWAGFRMLDAFGKQVLSNAAVNAARVQVTTPAGLAKLTKNHAAYFGDDLPQLVADLKSGQLTPLTMEYTWRRVSDAQPLTSVDMPTARTANPNARFLWSLKSYMIKQLTLMRKEGVDKLRRGDPDGAKFLLRYALIVGGAQAGMEWIVNSMWGKDDDLTWGDIPLNALKNFGISKYALEQLGQGNVGKAAAAFVAPPLLVLTEVLEGKPEAVQRIPVVGKPIYMRLMGGAEKANAKAERKREAEERKLLGGG